jgi:predicted aldo/keto reductase-like oxidoreductase
LQGGIEAYKKLKNQGKIRFIGFSADGPSTGVEQMISSNEFDMMQIHYNLMYQSTYDSFGSRGVIADAESRGMGIILMRSTTSQSFQRLMHHSFPDQISEAEIDSFLLNYVLSNPLVDVALMSLQSSEDVIWTNAVSDATDTRINLQKIHGR